MAAHNGRVVLVACQVMEPELERLRAERPHVEVRYLEQSLHRTPQMPERVQAVVDEAAAGAERIVLGYGLCSNGIMGVRARRQELIIPRCHDCIAFFLGSAEAHRREMDSPPRDLLPHPGVDGRAQGPPRHHRGRLRQAGRARDGRVGHARGAAKHYTRVALIDTGVTDIAPLRARAQENARFFGMRYEEIRGDSLEYFVKLIDGPYAEADFLRLAPGEAVTQEMFMD